MGPMRHEHWNDGTVRYPAGARPGDRLTWRTQPGPDYGDRTGVVLDRAANGVASQSSDQEAHPWEASGYWLWMMPDDGGEPVRIRYYARGRSRGTAHEDDGPMYERSSTGRNRVRDRGHVYDIGAWLSHRGRGPCACCERRVEVRL